MAQAERSSFSWLKHLKADRVRKGLVCVCVCFSYPINTLFVSEGEPVNSSAVGHSNRLSTSVASEWSYHTIPKDYGEIKQGAKISINKWLLVETLTHL